MPSSILLSIVLLATPAAQQAAPAVEGATPAPAVLTEGAAVGSGPVPIDQVLAMRPFILEQGFQSDWRAERPAVTSGWLMAIEVDRLTARARQTAMPVLYVGTEVAERLNDGGPASASASPEILRLVVIVPAPLAEDGSVSQPLRTHPAFFGRAVLPEQIDATRVAAEIAAAANAGIDPPSPEALESASSQGGALLRAADRAALLKAGAALLRVWSPTERDQADLLEGKPVVTSPAARNPA
jgi:hypothetical protein